MLGYSPIILLPSRYLLSYMLDIVTPSFSLRIFVSFIYMLFAVIPIPLVPFPSFSVFHCTITITRILYTSFLHISTHLLFP